MRILQLHSDFFEYQPTKKEIDNAEETELKSVKYENIVVLLTCIEKDDDQKTANKAFEDVLKSLKTLGSNRIILYPYAHLSRRLATPIKALNILKNMEKIGRSKQIEVYRAPFGWTKTFTIRVKGHPLAEQLKIIEPNDTRNTKELSNALKVETKIISKWYISIEEGKLIDIEQYNFNKGSNLEKFKKYELSKSRIAKQIPPHVLLMKRLMIADYEPGSDSGNMRYYPKGRLIKGLIEQFVTEKVKEYGGVEVETPIMYDIEHPSLSSYLNRFPARQYTIKSDDKEMFLRFSACFGQFLMLKDFQLSYKQLPFRIYELTRYSFRREKSGEVSGLRRLRAFTMPDCHAICQDLEQAKTEMIRRFDLFLNVLEGIGLSKDEIQLALRFTRQFYEENKEFLRIIINKFGKHCLTEVWEDRFFYFTFKWEFNFIDNLEKASALSTDQIDVENARRYDIFYKDESDNKCYPIILHNSPSGAIERCIYALLEKAYMMEKKGGSPSLPVWLSPTQLRIIPVNKSHFSYVEEIADYIESNKIRVDIDDRDETISKRIRSAEREWVPYIAVIGEKETSSKTYQVRDRSSRKIRTMNLEELISEIALKSKDKPFQRLPLPRHLSKYTLFPT